MFFGDLSEILAVNNFLFQLLTFSSLSTSMCLAVARATAFLPDCVFSEFSRPVLYLLTGQQGSFYHPASETLA